MSDHIFTDQNFEQEVLKSPVPVLIDFWAVWCAPCRVQSPIVEELAKEFDNSKIKIGKMNVDENPETPGKYNILSIPTLILFKNGKPAEQLIGLRNKDELKKIIEKHTR